MKKMTMRVAGNILECCSALSDKVERFEVISFFNFTPTAHAEVCNIRLREGTGIEEIKGDFISDIIVIKKDGRDHTCLVEGTFSEELSCFINAFDLKLEYPVIFENNMCQFSMIGYFEELYGIVKAARENGWEFEIISVQKYDPYVSSVLNALTDKQKEIIMHAYSSGYFDYPRKINAELLAKKIGMHKTTLLEHLHKAEKRLIGHIIEQTS